MLADQGPLRKRLRTLQRRARQGRAVDSALQALGDDVARSCAERRRRQQSLPVPRYPHALPVVERREEIGAAIAAHQVVIVCGETGSGKTTQLPKICLALGRGAAGMIGHTQPRRIAARSLAARIAEELGTGVGDAVGYKVRFQDRVGRDSFVKVMTDGILLAETQENPDLNQYDTLIIDEAHERSLNIDFLLGYLKRLLPRRPDLKVIITSATIDPERFSRHFDDAPVIQVSGRTYPVEIRYRERDAGDLDSREADLPQAVVDAVDELARAGSGDVLVFLPGEREIRESAERLRKHHPPHTEILPLYARLSADQQNRVFQGHGGRRIVLATNVAETSLTVPGIRYVVDSGLARISRYSYRTKVQRLPVEAVSQASADQRAGRCGRVAAGICIRLYGEQDYRGRARYTEPEIRRTNLAAVILQMLALGLGDIERFPFIDPPDSRYVRDGFKLLHELGAVDGRQRLTDIGRQLARLPVDPRLGRMVLAAREERCLHEALIIVSALAVQDPRERPLDQQQAADEKHRLFSDPRSDFLAYLKLWESYHEQQRHLSQNKLRKWCREHFLSFMRLRDWHDTHRQLKELAAAMAMRPDQTEAGYDAVHRALLAGLLGNVAFKTDNREYTGARNLKLSIFPGSALGKKGPKWIMAAELLETGRRYAHTVAAIEPQWVERLAGDLVKRNYFEPHWEKRPARVAAFEKVTLYGLVLAARRKVNYGSIDPVLSRELFIRGALVRGEYQTRAAFFAHNRALVREIETLEAKSRRRDLLVDEELLYRFYDERIPQGICSGAAFERWRREAEALHPGLLELTRDFLMQHGADGITEARFPDHLEIAGLRLALSYHFDPGSERDGVAAIIPLAAVNQLQAEPFEWLVPGLLQEKVIALIKSLPKGLRRHFVPAPQFADACIQALNRHDQPLLDAVGGQLTRMTGVEIPAGSWRPEQLPVHLFMRFVVTDSAGRELAAGRDLGALQAQLGERAQRSFRARSWEGLERGQVESWDFGPLPEVVEAERDGMTVRGYPALVDAGDGAALRVLDAPDAAREAHRVGVLRLFRRQAARAIKDVARHLPGIDRMCLHYAALGRCDDLKRDLVDAIVWAAFYPQGGDGEVRTPEAFADRARQAQARLGETANAICGWVASALAEYHEAARQLKGSVPPQWLAAVGDARGQLDALVYPGFVTHTSPRWLRHLPRYVQAVNIRLKKLDRNPVRDRQNMLAVAPLWQRYAERAAADAGRSEKLEEYRWMLEEYRVSLFAQELRTAYTVSPKRLDALWRELQA